MTAWDQVCLSRPEFDTTYRNIFQYQELKTGDIRLKRRITETTVKRWDTDSDQKIWGNLDAHRIIYAASVCSEGSRDEKEFTYVKYEGTDAVQVRTPSFSFPDTTEHSASL